MRLIDADELIRVYFDDEDGNKTFEFVPGEFIDNAPTIEAEPIKHGYWIIRTGQGGKYMCNICRSRWNKSHRYCPNCGGKMTR